MINVVGTSHVSRDSIEKIDEAFNEFQPDVVCLELDKNRLVSLLSDDDSLEAENLVHELLARFQRYIGEKTGMMPGEEMLYAYEKAKETGAEIYLIDQDLRITLGRIGEVRRKEKAKAVALMPLSFFGASTFDYTKIPDEKALQELTETFKNSFPELYQVFVEERDHHMAESLKAVKKKHPEESIVAVVGAAHQQGLEERLDEIDSEGSMEKEER